MSCVVKKYHEHIEHIVRIDACEFVKRPSYQG